MTGTLRPGMTALVTTVTALWTSPRAPRRVDATAVDPKPAIDTWVTSLDRQLRYELRGRTLTQLLLGEPVVVEDIDGDWAQVIALEQPHDGLDPRGYPGWVPLRHLAPGSAPAAQDCYTVHAPFAVLHPGGTVSRATMKVTIGTKLVSAGDASRSQLAVRVPGSDQVLRVDRSLVTPYSQGNAVAARQMCEIAHRLIDTPYIWGGLTPHGIDCSGLVHLAHRTLGAMVPRDADAQADVSQQVPQHGARPGDLYFFAREGSIDHVGIRMADGDILHASESAGRVVREPLRGKLAERLIGVRRMCQSEAEPTTPRATACCPDEGGLGTRPAGR